MPWATSNNVLKDSGQPTLRSRAFAIPILVKSLKPNSIYQFFVSNINMGWACKPFGGTLGANLVTDNTGTLNFKFLYDQRHQSGIIANNNDNSPVTSQLLCHVVDTSNSATYFYIPVHLKVTQ